jgi:hypothetical protein
MTKRRTGGRKRSSLRIETLSAREFIIPVLHSNRRDMAVLQAVLDGSCFYVKRLGGIHKTSAGSYFLLAKIKQAAFGASS